MTPKLLLHIAFILVFAVASTNAFASYPGRYQEHTATDNKILSNSIADIPSKIPALPVSHAKIPTGKIYAPHMEELPHLYKFHKERVRKIRRHHGKYWRLTQLILVLCHLSILLIGYLHATH